jgi:hypothetical protein
MRGCVTRTDVFTLHLRVGVGGFVRGTRRRPFGVIRIGSVPIIVVIRHGSEVRHIIGEYRVPIAIKAPAARAILFLHAYFSFALPLSERFGILGFKLVSCRPH